MNDMSAAFVNNMGTANKFELKTSGIMKYFIQNITFQLMVSVTVTDIKQPEYFFVSITISL